jgi:hypothetical protein
VLAASYDPQRCPGEIEDVAADPGDHERPHAVDVAARGPRRQTTLTDQVLPEPTY